MSSNADSLLQGAALEAAIGKKMFPKVTKESIDARIKSVDYFQLGETPVMVCAVTMVNGFTVRGEAACVDPRNFDEQIGRSLSYQDAYRKLWQLEGYLLAESIMQTTQGDKVR